MLPPLFGLLIALVVLFLVASLFFGISAHLASRAVVGETSVTESFAVGLAPAMGVVSGVVFTPAVVPFIAIPLDVFAIVTVFELEGRVAATVLGVHFVLSVLGWLALVAVFQLL